MDRVKEVKMAKKQINENIEEVIKEEPVQEEILEEPAKKEEHPKKSLFSSKSERGTRLGC